MLQTQDNHHLSTSEYRSDLDLRVKAAIDILHESISEEVSVDYIARQVNLSPSRLRQLFARSVGRSPLQYLKALRIQRAEELLLTTFLSIKQVTHLAGMADVSHFVRDFKKRYGVTPSSFRGRSSRHTLASSQHAAGHGVADSQMG